MRILLDTCSLLWWWAEPEKLSPRCRSLIQDPANEIWVSAGSAWEISTKHRIGKFSGGDRIISQWDERLLEDGFRELPISCAHALRAGSLPGTHGDPFDRVIAAQAIIGSLRVATPDKAISGLGAECAW